MTGENAPAIQIQLLGSFSVTGPAGAVESGAWRLRKGKSLVKLVAIAPDRRVHREAAAEALWPERDAASARNNFHQALHAARRALDSAGVEGAAMLPLEDDVLALAPEAAVDVEGFEAAAAAARASEDPAIWWAALEAFPGELLPEDRYESWAEPRREAVRELRLALCLELAELLETRGEPGEAARALQTALVDDPLHEPARRALMRVYAGLGRRQEALAQYQSLRRQLDRELAAEPDPETKALYRELLSDEGEGAHAAPQAAHNLPRQLTSFVGRERECATVGRLLDRVPALTLTGPGGCGKTRLAIEVAGNRLDRYPGGAWLVELAALSDPALVPQGAAIALGVPIPAQRDPTDAVVAHLAGREMLIVLDNCEHLIEACAHLVEALRRGCPGVTVLATSRQPLRCAGETTWRVPSLSLPQTDDLQGSEAARLFIDRAGAANPSAAVATAEDQHTVAVICRYLDGMPLAIELAAARVAIFSPQQIVEHLGDSLDVLTTGARTAMTRQQTLRATIAWSHDLLDEEERVLFRRCAVFAGTFTLAMVEQVCTDSPLEPRQTADLLARLVEKSLVTTEAEDPAQPRFRMLETIRQFAAEQLAGAGERRAVGSRHLDWCLELAAEGDPRSSRAGGSLSLLELQHDDLRAALVFALAEAPEAALLLATRLCRFWLDRSYFAEGAGWLDAVLESSADDVALRVEAELGRAGFALRRGDASGYLRHAEEAVALHQGLDAERSYVATLHQYAALKQYASETDEAEALFDEALTLAGRLGDERLLASVTHASALSPWYRGDVATTRGRLEDALRLLEGLSDDPEAFFLGISFGMPVLPEGPAGADRAVWEETLHHFNRYDRDVATVYALNNVAWAARCQGDWEGAAAALERALAGARELEDAAAQAATLVHIGCLARSRGNFDAGVEPIEASLDLRRDLGDVRAIALSVMCLALLNGRAGRLDQAREQFGAALASAERVDDAPGVAATLMNWGLVEEAAGHDDLARPLYERSIPLSERQRMITFSAWTRVGLADVLERLGESGAAEVLAEARAQFEQTGDARGLQLTAKSALTSR